MEKQCELRNATRSTWEFHVGKACCKILQYWRRIPCKCTLSGPREYGIPMSAVRCGGAGRVCSFPCKELAKNGSPWQAYKHFTWNSHVRRRLQDRFPWQFPCKYVSLVSFTWQIPCKSALASFNEASGELPRHISQSYLISLSDILFSEVFHADDVSAKIWWCSGSLTSRIFQAIWLTCSGSLLQ